MDKRLLFRLAMVRLWLLGGQLGSAQDTHGKVHAELAKALRDVKVSLAEGLTASAQEGTPISGKFELENGHTSPKLPLRQLGVQSIDAITPMNTAN